MNDQNKGKDEKVGGSGNSNISSLKDSKDSGVINRIWKSGRGVDIETETKRKIEGGL